MCNCLGKYCGEFLILITLSWNPLIATFFPPSSSLLLAQLIISLSTIGVPSQFSWQKFQSETENMKSVLPVKEVRECMLS